MSMHALHFRHDAETAFYELTSKEKTSNITVEKKAWLVTFIDMRLGQVLRGHLHHNTIPKKVESVCKNTEAFSSKTVGERSIRIRLSL